jgi:ABC-type transport system involved in cytochrome bd biosynthesis fused ATPase/permease subunit
LTDLIIVLKDGKVAEQGTHQELLAMEGVYATLWGYQSQEATMESILDSREQNRPENVKEV